MDTGENGERRCPATRGHIDYDRRDRRRSGPIVTPALMLTFLLLTLGNYTPKGIKIINNCGYSPRHARALRSLHLCCHLPEAPVFPAGPAGPTDPANPGTPAGPGAPSVPGAPRNPVAPVTPVSPIIPRLPVGPGTPRSPV